MKLPAVLAEFQAWLDRVASDSGGSQIVGRVHQVLLGGVLGQMGYEGTLNSMGVPDIMARGGASKSVGDILSRVRDLRS